MFELTLNTLVLFVSQGGLVFVCGTADGIIKVSGRRHNCDDLKATILAVDPIKFVYRGRLDTNRESVYSKSFFKPSYSPSVISPSPFFFQLDPIKFVYRRRQASFKLGISTIILY